MTTIFRETIDYTNEVAHQSKLFLTIWGEMDKVYSRKFILCPIAKVADPSDSVKIHQ